MLVTAAVVLARGREALGVNIATVGLVIALTAGALVSLYVEQVSALGSTLVRAGLLFAVVQYRNRFVGRDEPNPLPDAKGGRRPGRTRPGGGGVTRLVEGGYPHPDDAGWRAGHTRIPGRMVPMTGNTPSREHVREVDTAMDEQRLLRTGAEGPRTGGSNGPVEGPRDHARVGRRPGEVRSTGSG